MDKIKKGYKKWFVINIGHYLEKSIIKTEKSITEINVKICQKKKIKNKRVRVTIQAKYVEKRKTKK